MISKKHKLTGKDINYIIKKKVFIKGKYFNFMVIPQYQNKKYNQFGIQISTKISKFSTKRNFIKRVLIDYLKQNNYYFNSFSDSYYKIFVLTNQFYFVDFKKSIETNNKNIIKKQIIDNFEESLFFLNNKLGRK